MQSPERALSNGVMYGPKQPPKQNSGLSTTHPTRMARELGAGHTYNAGGVEGTRKTPTWQTPRQLPVKKKKGFFSFFTPVTARKYFA